MPEILELLKYGFFAFLGVVVATIAGRRKTGSEVRKLDEEAERLNIENQNLRAEQMNNLLKENSELLKAKEDLRTKLHISDEKVADLTKQLREQAILNAEIQSKLNEMLANQKDILELQQSQQKDISNIAKQTGPLPSRDELNNRQKP
jgi:predicted RNase H-like nuclease (RuvC/YqgF family)